MRQLHYADNDDDRDSQVSLSPTSSQGVFHCAVLSLVCISRFFFPSEMLDELPKDHDTLRHEQQQQQEDHRVKRQKHAAEIHATSLKVDKRLERIRDHFACQKDPSEVTLGKCHFNPVFLPKNSHSFQHGTRVRMLKLSKYSCGWRRKPPGAVR
jgi:hypothetical protein